MKPLIQMNEAQEREYHTVILGALLHDVGKYLQRSRGTTWGKGKHPRVSVNFIDDWKEKFDQCTEGDLLKILAQRHHESQKFEDELNVNSIKDDHIRTLARLVSKADNMASFERALDKGKSQHYRTTPLATVFHHIQLTKTKPDPPHYINITSLENLNIEPPILSKKVDKNIPEEVTQIIHRFGQEFEKYADLLDWSDCTFRLPISEVSFRVDRSSPAELYPFPRMLRPRPP